MKKERKAYMFINLGLFLCACRQDLICIDSPSAPGTSMVHDDDEAEVAVDPDVGGQ